MNNDHAEAIADRAATLGRILTTFQLSVGHEMPVIVLRESAKTIQDVARDLIAIIDADDTATTLVAFDPTLGPNVAALLGQALGEPTPDHLPGWVDGCSDGDGATWSGLDFTPSQLRDLLAEADVPLQLQFRDFTEPLRADRLAPGLYRLRCFSDFVPLATGDIVTVEEDTMAVTGWHQLEDTWIVRAFFDLSRRVASTGQGGPVGLGRNGPVQRHPDCPCGLHQPRLDRQARRQRPHGQHGQPRARRREHFRPCCRRPRPPLTPLSSRAGPSEQDRPAGKPSTRGRHGAALEGSHCDPPPATRAAELTGSRQVHVEVAERACPASRHPVHQRS